MKGICYTKELTKNGLFISEMDEDTAYKNKANPRGTFVMIVEPIEGEIHYKKTDEGYLVLGEGFILDGRKDRLWKKIEEWKQKYVQPKNVIFIEESYL